MNMMKTSQAGIDLIKEFEGVRLAAYRCPAGVPTIGYGHTKGVEMGDTVTVIEAEELLREDLEVFENGVNKLVEVPLEQHQFDALVSFAFNLGLGNLKNSTLLRLLNQGLYTDAANQLTRWNKAGGQVLAGLVRRRSAERRMFLGE